MINNSIYQKIFNELSAYLIKGWDKLIVYLEYGEDSYSFSFYERVNDQYIKCFDIPSVQEKDLDKTFKKIYDAVTAERTGSKDEWSNMTMIVDSKGDMHTDFDYTDLSAGNYSYMKEWKKRYLV